MRQYTASLQFEVEHARGIDRCALLRAFGPRTLHEAQSEHESRTRARPASSPAEQKRASCHGSARNIWREYSSRCGGWPDLKPLLNTHFSKSDSIRQEGTKCCNDKTNKGVGRDRSADSWSKQTYTMEDCWLTVRLFPWKVVRTIVYETYKNPFYVSIERPCAPLRSLPSLREKERERETKVWKSAKETSNDVNLNQDTAESIVPSLTVGDRIEAERERERDA